MLHANLASAASQGVLMAILSVSKYSTMDRVTKFTWSSTKFTWSILEYIAPSGNGRVTPIMRQSKIQNWVERALLPVRQWN